MNTTSARDTPSTAQDRHTFSIYTAPGVNKQGLKQAWCTECRVCKGQYIIADIRDILYKLYPENEVIQALAQIDDVHCIISFQVYQDGEQFAVARLWKPRKAVATVQGKV